MGIVIWKTVGEKYCALIQKPAALQEGRIYADNFLYESEASYQLLGQRCTVAVDCNMAMIPCHFAFTNPELNRFDEETL